MGISDEAIRARDFIAQNAPQFAVGADADEIRSRATTTANAQKDDIERIEVEGQEAVAAGPLTEGERRNLEARLAGEEFDAIRQAELAGTRSGRIEITGAGAQEKQRAVARQKAKAEADARTQALLALQAALEALDADIARLDGEIKDILDPYLSPAERAHIDGIEDPAEKAREELRLAREKLANGEMSQAEFDRFKARWDERAQKMLARKTMTAEAENAKTPEELEHLVKKYGAATSEAVAESLDEPEREFVDQAVDEDRIEGNEVRQNAVKDSLNGWGLPGGDDTALDKAKGMAKTDFAEAAPNKMGNNEAAPDRELVQTASNQPPPPGTG